MNIFLLSGDREDQKKYIDSFVKKKSLKSYQIISLESEKIKIAQVREIKKMLTVKYESSRLIILWGECTLDAQNALLKTLEELSENIYIVLCVATLESVIPTIISRSKVIPVTAFLGSFNTIVDKSLKMVLRDYLNGNNLAVFKLTESCGFSTQEEFDKFIKFLRNELRESVLNNNYVYTSTLLRIIQNIMSKYPQVKNNNVNRRFFIESVFLSDKSF